jgi:NADP-dependent 3-hydroxy acid dehydrogenase YdfG
MRGLVTVLDAWVKDGKEPPPSVFPRIADGTLVAWKKNEIGWPAIPGVAYPEVIQQPAYLDRGPQWDSQRIATIEPPQIKGNYVVKVPAVDADGNERGTLNLPAVTVPVATYTSWNLRNSSIGAAGELLALQGGYIAFPLTREARQEAKDPRPSIAERYSELRLLRTPLHGGGRAPRSPPLYARRRLATSKDAVPALQAALRKVGWAVPTTVVPMQPSKVALITGSARRRLGWHVADALGGRGYAVVIHYNTSAEEAESAAKEFRSRGIQAISIGADLADESQVRRLVDETLKQFGRIDVLVNCAAIWKSKRLEEVTADDVRSYFNTNTLGTFLCCQHAGLAMVRQPEGGSIITFGDWAIERPYMNYAAYFPSKGAIPALTRCLCRRAGHSQPEGFA